MPCYRPLDAFRCKDGAVVFRDGPDVVRSVQLPCGQCVGCRLEYSRQWAVRLMHEAQLHGVENMFVTLTFDPKEWVPSIDYAIFQRFMHRVRKYALRRLRLRKVRFYMAGEYDDRWRPHFHACLFGLRFPDLVYWCRGAGGSRLYRSAALERLWPYGFSSAGEVTFESAAYVARYVMKKVDRRKEELNGRVPEYTHMSLRPGLAAGWLSRYWSDVFPHGRVVARGKEGFAPRYYVARLREQDPGAYAKLLEEREIEAAKSWCDRTPDRQAVRERVAAARAAFLRRNLKGEVDG